MRGSLHEFEEGGPASAWQGDSFEMNLLQRRGVVPEEISEICALLGPQFAMAEAKLCMSIIAGRVEKSIAELTI